MTWFLKSIDYDLWDIIQNGPHIPTKMENEIVILKLSQECKEFDKKKAQLNAKAIYYLHYSIDRYEYNCVC